MSELKSEPGLPLQAWPAGELSIAVEQRERSAARDDDIIGLRAEIGALDL